MTAGGALAPALLAAALARMTGEPLPEVTALERLSGGANMESWAFAAQGKGYVLRRMPENASEAARGVSMATEAALLRLAGSRGVKVPEIIGELAPGDQLGQGFVMARVAGTAAPRAILQGPGGEALAADCAAQAAAIHHLPLAQLPELPHFDTAAEIERMRGVYAAHGGNRPVLALALRWLQDNMPPPVPPAFVHGDFRLGNLMVEDGTLTAVLDWELPHLGDPCRDIGFACINSWRFGQRTRPALGLTSLEKFTAAYEAAGGMAISAARLHFWIVFGTLNWGLICLHMAQMYRDGEDRTLERLAIGRRVSETEADLLLLLETGLPALDATLEPVAKAMPAAGPGVPSAVELLRAISQWLREEIRPELTSRARFMASVALNSLSIVERELAAGPLPETAGLAEQLLAGTASLETPGVLALLRRSVRDQLAIDQPNYSALQQMTEEWERENVV